MIWHPIAKPANASRQALSEILLDLAANSNGNGLASAFQPVIHAWQGTGRSWTAFIGDATRSGRPGFVVKFITIGNSAAERTQRATQEYDVLCRVHREFVGHAELTVPRPIAIYPAAAAVVMTHCNGVCLTQYLSRASTVYSTNQRRRACNEAVTRCARWLRTARQIDLGVADVQTLRREHVRAMGARLELARSHRLLSEATIERLFERYVSDSDAVPWDSLDCGFVHHDFGSHNILATNDGICVIDLGDSRMDFVLQDVSRLWLELSVIAASRALPADRRFTLDLRERFLDAYALDAVQRSVGLFATNAALARLLNGHSHKTRRTWPRWRHKMAHFLQHWLNDHALKGVLA